MRDSVGERERKLRVYEKEERESVCVRERAFRCCSLIVGIPLSSVASARVSIKSRETQTEIKMVPSTPK